MNHPLPNDKIFILPYTLTTEGYDIEFRLTTTLLGEVLDVQCPILDLPAAAQKLMLGPNYQLISRAAKGFSSLFYYTVPLIVLGYLDTEEWQPLKKAWIKAAQNRSVPAPKTKYIQHEWVKSAYEIDSAGDRKRQLLQVGKLLMQDAQKRYAALVDYNESKELDYYDATFFGPVLIRLLPISKSPSILREIYKSLATYPTETNYLLLTNRLTNMTYKKYHAAILQGLQPYQKASLEPVLAMYFNNKPLLGGDELKLFMATLVRLPEPSRKKLLYEVLTSENRQAALKAYSELKQSDLTEQELAAQLYSKFIKRQSLSNIRAILKLYDQLKDTSLLPTGGELIAVLVWANKEKKALGINHAITPLLKKRLKQKEFPQLLAHLKSDNYTLQEATIMQVLALGDTQHIVDLNQITEEVVAPFQAQLIYHTKKLLKKYSERDSIEPLVKILPTTKQLQVETLKAMRRVLQYRQDKTAIPVLLQALEVEHSEVRKYSLLTLRIFKDKAVISAIKSLLKTEDHPIVRKTAQKSLDWIANPLPESRKIEREIKEKREIYLEELIANSEKENGRPLPGISRFAIKWFGRMYYSHFPKEEWKE